MAKNIEILMRRYKCKTKAGGIVYYSVYQRKGGVEVEGPTFENHRCHSSVKTAEDAKIQIAKIYGVEVIS
jgi:hypothetical protein